MSRLNVRAKGTPVHTHEGAVAFPHLKPIDQLRRSVLACLLWEDTFYEDGKAIADRIREGAAVCDPRDVGNLAVEARKVFNLRHAPLMLLNGLLSNPKAKGSFVGDAIAETISRADELAEMLTIYWTKDGKMKRRPIAAQLKQGLAKAFLKFNEFQLARYNRDSVIKLRDVLFLCHAKADTPERDAMWKRLIKGEMPTPETWETELSSGKDKKETFERLIREGKLGYFALIRNLRNMVEAGCDHDLIAAAIISRKGGADKLFPFRYIAAARHAPAFDHALDIALGSAIAEMPKLKGSTIVLVDVSGSMTGKLSGKSEMTRIDAAAALASIIPAEKLRVFTFDNGCYEVPARRGLAGVDAIKREVGGGTNIPGAIQKANDAGYDRLIVISDEQTMGRYGALIDPLPGTKAYMINVASYQHGVGYGKWTHLDGFSDAIIRWITLSEGE